MHRKGGKGKGWNSMIGLEEKERDFPKRKYDGGGGGQERRGFGWNGLELEYL